jgi:hypothetical protein
MAYRGSVAAMINALQRILSEAEAEHDAGNLSGERLEFLESALVDIGRLIVPSITGPSGYNPKPTYELCDTCNRYRLRQP